jgi:hypothetical protein
MYAQIRTEQTCYIELVAKQGLNSFNVTLDNLDRSNQGGWFIDLTVEAVT